MNYKINDQKVQEVVELKDLGIIIDNRLTFNKHTEKIALQAYKVLELITTAAKDFSNASTLVKLFTTLVVAMY